MFVTLALLFCTLTYALVALRHALIWRFPDGRLARWLEVRDPVLQALVARSAAPAPRPA